MKTWGGRRVRLLVQLVLEVKGTTCHLCGLPGADSADHDPPRSVLVASGCPDPDALEYLHPAHRVPCNVGRRARPITDALRAELRALRLRAEGRATASLSPRFARHRADFLRAADPGGRSPSAYIPAGPEKNRRTR